MIFLRKNSTGDRETNNLKQRLTSLNIDIILLDCVMDYTSCTIHIKIFQFVINLNWAEFHSVIYSFQNKEETRNKARTHMFSMNYKLMIF